MRFFNEDVHKAWLKWTKAVSEPIRESIPIITEFPLPEPTPEHQSDESPRAKRRKTDHGISSLDVDYAREKEYVSKAKEIVDFEREGACSVCQKDLEHDAGIYTICPNPECDSVTHMTCLSKHFLKDEPETMIPINGTCPSCKIELRWVDVVKELSLRMRGQKEVERLLKAKRTRKGKATASHQVESDVDDDEVDALEREIYEEIKQLQEFNPTASKLHMGDEWHIVDDSDDTDTGSVISNASQSRKAASGPSNAGTLPTVIEDSDWDDAVVLD